ncbi:MAG: hypothetical protein AAF432_13720 [Planctomycetota bacterium]
MFRQPKCPVDTPTRVWIEEALVWLARQFGDDQFFAHKIVAPNNDTFPVDDVTGRRSIESIFQSVCALMGVDRAHILLQEIDDAPPLHLVNDDGLAVPTAPAGLYEEHAQGYTIHISRAELIDTLGLIGTLSHEVAHFCLRGEGRIEADTLFCEELLTDLTTVYFGFGVIRAASPREWQSDYSTWPGTDVVRPEYMSIPMYGYALAVLAWLHDDASPGWSRMVRGDVGKYFKPSLRYLGRTNDSGLHAIRDCRTLPEKSGPWIHPGLQEHE